MEWCGYLLLEFIYDLVKNKTINKKIIFSLCLVFLLLFITAYPLFGCLSTNKDIGSGNNSILMNSIFAILIEPIAMIEGILGILIRITIVVAISIIIVLYLIFFIIKYNCKDFLKISIVLLWQYFIYAFLYGMSYQRANTVFWVIIFFVWIREYNTNTLKKDVNSIEKLIKNVGIIILMVFNILTGIFYMGIDVLYNYSSAKETAEFINENIEDESIMITGNQVEFCSSIACYTEGIKYYYIQREDFFSYVILDEVNRLNLTEEEFLKTLEKFDDENNLYYIYSNVKVTKASDKKVVENMEEKGILEKIFQSKKAPLSNESYVIYRVMANEIK